MIRSLCLVALACSISSADQAPKSVRIRIPAQSCLAPTNTDIANVQSGAVKKSTEARSKAMQAIKPLALRAHDHVVGEGIAVDSKLVLRGPVATTTIGGVTGRFVVGPAQWSGAAVHVDLAWQFGIVNGKAVRLVPQPRVVSETTIVICGCRPQACGPFGSGCPGCGSTTQTVFGPLPVGLDYAGDHPVPHDAYTATLEYRGTSCPALKPCPQPP